MSNIIKEKKRIADNIGVMLVVGITLLISKFCYVDLSYAGVFNIVLGSLFLSIPIILGSFYIKGCIQYRKYIKYETYTTEGVIEVDKNEKKLIIKTGTEEYVIDLANDSYDYIFDVIAFKDSITEKWYKIQHDNTDIIMEISFLISRK